MDRSLEINAEGLAQPEIHRAGLLTFTHLNIRNIGRLNKKPFTGIFCREDTFPAARSSVAFTKDTPPAPLEAWKPIDIYKLSPTRRRLKLSLGKRIGEGGTATVYSATVQSSSNFDLPKTVCVKVAKSSRNRSLAREAWYYEQLSREENCEGIATPRCFGFFAMCGVDPPEAVSGTTFRPWQRIEYGDEEDILRDDYLHPGDSYLRDEHGLTAKSMWHGFKQGESVIICVLVLEELGAPYPSPLIDDDALRDIREILTDLAHVGIVHDDARFNNVLRPLITNSNTLCSRHKKIHNWRLIDFDRARRFLISESNPSELSSCFEEQFLDFDRGQNSYFMRGIPS
ncbi:hypothetical protein M413DRAFT_449430 [Hebeloma cylindrosporum]|uniref:Protein kinase domain-containing protein n=1 Tax=Hebeloma cylindrosporum TaxID=76867 RepID=A0A0C3BVN5_HEBCY|nr:hypothetical protein M413DRAFT_449430 [Hebeloma cylindrosporum h7]